MKQRVIFSVMAVILLSGLFFFGKTSKEKQLRPESPAPAIAAFDVQRAIDSLRSGLTATQQAALQKIENNVTRGDVKNQTADQLTAMANFWKDSASQFIPYAYYLSEAAKLDNSEKNLTFAGQFILENMRRESHNDLKLWEAQTAAGLFEQALKLNPSSHELKIGLGSCFVYGPGMTGDPQETMKGIQMLLEVVRQDSNNMKAQMVLGIASVISNQADKGVDRLTKVVNFDPHNLEAVSWLADAYAAKGDVANAKKWYEQSKHIVNNPAFSKEVDERIKMLEQH